MADGPGVTSPYRLGGFALVALFLPSVLAGPLAEGWAPHSLQVTAPEPTPQPFSDRLAIPVLGESPTQVETGRYLYYYHCMPCHGDRGQGLTDEWRTVWVEDHQNCWARGCHTGKSELTAFYIPRSVPAVSGLGHFQTDEQLFLFIRETQPPQRPGDLSDSDYWALTAFLLHENGRLSPGAEIGPEAAVQAVSNTDLLIATLALLLALAVAWWLGKRRGKTQNEPS